jgi:hypothetical protein
LRVRVCVAHLHGYGGGAVAIATQCGTGDIRDHFWPHSRRAGGPTRVPQPASHPSGRSTYHPMLSTRPYTQGTGRGDTQWAPLWHTATVVHRMHASTSLRPAKPRRAVGLPQHQEGRCPCDSSQVLDAHPPCFTRTGCTISRYTPAQRFPWYPWTFSSDLMLFFFKLFMCSTSWGSRLPLSSYGGPSRTEPAGHAGFVHDYIALLTF